MITNVTEVAAIRVTLRNGPDLLFPSNYYYLQARGMLILYIMGFLTSSSLVRWQLLWAARGPSSLLVLFTERKQLGVIVFPQLRSPWILAFLRLR